MRVKQLNPRYILGMTLTWPNVSVNWFSFESYTPISMQATQYKNGMTTIETK